MSKKSLAFLIMMLLLIVGCRVKSTPDQNYGDDTSNQHVVINLFSIYNEDNSVSQESTSDSDGWGFWPSVIGLLSVLCFCSFLFVWWRINVVNNEPYEKRGF